MAPPSLESTATLVQRVRDGDAVARERLMARCLPLLQRWAHGRLPRYGRSLAETDDLVQVSLLRSLNNINHIDSSRPGALLAYLRKVLMNAVREEIRRSGRRPSGGKEADSLADEGQSVLDRVIGRETLDAYDAALQTLTAKQREAVMLRLEFGMTFPEIAAETESASPAAARMLVARALVSVADAMR